MTHHVSQEASFPVRIQQLSVEIEDIDTDILLCGYSDYVLVTVTQTESFGTIFQTRYISRDLLLYCYHLALHASTVFAQDRHEFGRSNILQH